MVCIIARMQCLHPLMEDPRFRGWSLQKLEDPECKIVNELIFKAVAKCSLRADKTHVWFEPDEFFRIALEERDPEGTA
jgi:hypothetical protein